MTAIHIEITATKGSAPRDAGTVMSVTQNGIQGTIGGGALEHRAIYDARQMLKSGQDTATQTIPLGPGLGQCCGGVVTLQFGRKAQPLPVSPAWHQHGVLATQKVKMPLWVWGAGHVGRAVVHQALGAQAFDVTWIDTKTDRFPEQVPDDIDAINALDMPRLAAHAPIEAHHLILTYSHDIDLALCAALLQRGFASCGLIGSDTKWTRFRKRLRAMGRDPSRIQCPIGDKTLGKHPDMIAQGTLAGILSEQTMEATA